jgi:hypothetical protein
MAYGSAFGAIQQVPQMVPGVPEVQQANQNVPPPQAAQNNQRIAARMTTVQEIGGLMGRL